MPRTRDSFIYKPLRTDSIRLVELLPGDWDDDIRCRLTHHVFDDTLEYEAVSYTWGRPGREIRILVNGGAFYIRKNLFRCLRRLRHGRRSLFLWIDAICIDQLTPSERNHNVGMMDDIFVQATRVYVWLGEGDEQTDLAMWFLRHELPRAFDEAHTMTAREEDGWIAVSELFNNPYWSRIWVVQEFVLARDVVFVCGGERAQGLPIVNAVSSVILMDGVAQRAEAALGSTRIRIKDVLKSIRDSHAIRLMAYRAQNNSGVGSPQSSSRQIHMQPLSELLENFHLSRCSVVQDYLYAMLSLAIDFYDDRESFVDYSLSELELFRRVVTHYDRMCRGRGLRDRELRAIAYLCSNFELQVPENCGPYAFSTNIEGPFRPTSQSVNMDVRVCYELLIAETQFPCFRLSPAHLLQKAGSPAKSEATRAEFAGIRWDLNITDDQRVSYRDVLNAGEDPSKHGPVLEGLPKVLVCTLDADKEFLKGLVCSQAREGDFLFPYGFGSHLAFIFRRSIHDEKTYMIVGTAICERASKSSVLKQGSMTGEALRLPMILGEGIQMVPAASDAFWMDILTLMKLVQHLQT